MRVSSFAVARPAYYDRNATRGRARYSNPFTAPHAQTARWTVTIAAGTKAFVETAVASIVSEANPSVVGFQRVQFGTDSTSAFSDVLIISQYTSLTLKPIISANCPTQFTLYAGQTLAAYTQDSSTGGTAEYAASTQYTVFDA